MCIGNNFALEEMKILLSTLLQNYSILPVHPEVNIFFYFYFYFYLLFIFIFIYLCILSLNFKQDQ